VKGGQAGVGHLDLKAAQRRVTGERA